MPLPQAHQFNLFKQFPMSAFIIDKNQHIVLWNDALDGLFNTHAANTLEKRLTDVFPTFAKDKYQAILCQLFQGKSPISFLAHEHINLFNDGKTEKTRYQNATLSLIHGDLNDDYVIIMIEDIDSLSEQIEAYKQQDNSITQTDETDKTRLLSYDAVTTLGNRKLYTMELPVILDRLHRTTLQGAVLFLGLDRFKRINDSLGHETGDALLAQVATRLKQVLRRTDHIYRIGGDEFAVVTEGKVSPENTARVAQKILNTINLPYQINDDDVFITMSIGIAMTENCGKDAETLSQCADTALHSAKEKGKDCYQFFSPSLNEKITRRVYLENLLQSALEKEEFSLHYQPIFNGKKHQLIGAEALLRWKNPKEKDLVSPMEFIPILEDVGLIIPVGEWVLHTACHHAAAWAKQFNFTKQSKISVNLSVRQLNQADLVETIHSILAMNNLQPKQLNLEITESTIMSNPEKNIATLHELHALGISISVDDFGTGYSSLGYLKSLPIDVLKIDRSFLQEVSTNQNSAMIVKSIIALAKNLGLQTIAEGVETEAQIKFLLKNGCTNMQGYYFCKPQPADVFKQLLHE